jgi:hypothetical protein
MPQIETFYALIIKKILTDDFKLFDYDSKVT